MPLEDFYKKIVVLEEFNLAEEVIIIINEHQAYLADLLAVQLAQGKDGNNQPVTLRRRGRIYDYYSDATIWRKEHFGAGLGRVTEYVTNYMSGAFYREMFVKVQGTTFEIESRVPYFDAIINQSGRIIMQLNEEHLRIFSEEIVIPEIQRKFSILWNGV